MPATQLLSGLERQWVQMWKSSVDNRGRLVRRGIGIPRDARDQMDYNRAGDGRTGTYLVGEFGADGRPAANILRAKTR